MAKFLSLQEKWQNLESGIWKSPFNNWIKIVTSLRSSTNRGKKSHLIAHFLPRCGEHDEDGPTLPEEGTPYIHRREVERDDADNILVLHSSPSPCRLCRLSHDRLYDCRLLLVMDGRDCTAPPLPLPSSLCAILALCSSPVSALPKVCAAFFCQ